MDENTAYDDLLFSVRRSVRYHNRRRMFFDRFNLLTNALSVIFGSATIYAVLAQTAAGYAVAAASLVTVFSAVNLVVGTVRMARLHADLSRRFIELEKRIIAASAPDAAQVASWTAQRLDIEADEPPVLRVLDSLCHNELMRAMGHDPSELLKIHWYQRLLAQFIDVRDEIITATHRA